MIARLSGARLLLLTLALGALALSSCEAPREPTSDIPDGDIVGAAPPYDRDKFGGWSDQDGDCMNTRHELLANLSTARAVASPDGCRIVHGRWLDPYTGRTFTEASDVEIDHLVPLAWAWRHGAWRWSDDRRREFANDARNLFAVQTAANRSKGADGPSMWLPSNEAFHCEYVLRFSRVAIEYDLSLPAPEAERLNRLAAEKCA